MITAQQIVDTWEAKYDSETGHSTDTLLVNLNLVLRDAYYKVANSDSRFFSKSAQLNFLDSKADLPSDFRTTAFIDGGLYNSSDKEIDYIITEEDKVKISDSINGALTLKYLPAFNDLTSLSEETIFEDAFLNALVFGLDREIHDTERNPIMEQNADAKFQRQLHMAMRATRKTSNVINLSR